MTIQWVICEECGHEQAYMGRNVACEECGARMPEPERCAFDGNTEKNGRDTVFVGRKD